jgi:hypothetical protein
VIYISKAAVPTQDLRPQTSASSWSSRATHQRPGAVEERESSWDANAAALIEFFSAQHVLVELAIAPLSYSDIWRYTNQAASFFSSASKAAPAAQPPHIPDEKLLELRPATLASMGYAARSACSEAGAGSIGPSAAHPSMDSAYQAAAAASSTSAARPWLVEAGWCSARTGQLQGVGEGLLVAHPIDPVVSSRLITSRSERDAVLQLAAAAAGMQFLDPAVSEPTQAVLTPADARWLAVPGRYAVSRKCDGTKHLLIVAADGGVHLLKPHRVHVRLSCVPNNHQRKAIPQQHHQHHGRDQLN